MYIGGKWERNHNGSNSVVLSRSGSQVEVIAELRPQIPIDEQIATAQLMAKAPEIFEEFKRLVTIMEQDGYFPDIVEYAKSLIEEVEICG